MTTDPDPIGLLVVVASADTVTIKQSIGTLLSTSVGTKVALVFVV